MAVLRTPAGQPAALSSLLHRYTLDELWAEPADRARDEPIGVVMREAQPDGLNSQAQRGEAMTWWGGLGVERQAALPPSLGVGTGGAQPDGPHSRARRGDAMTWWGGLGVERQAALPPSWSEEPR